MQYTASTEGVGVTKPKERLKILTKYEAVHPNAVSESKIEVPMDLRNSKGP